MALRPGCRASVTAGDQLSVTGDDQCDAGQHDRGDPGPVSPADVGVDRRVVQEAQAVALHQAAIPGSGLHGGPIAGALVTHAHGREPVDAGPQPGTDVGALPQREIEGQHDAAHHTQPHRPGHLATQPAPEQPPGGRGDRDQDRPGPPGRRAPGRPVREPLTLDRALANDPTHRPPGQERTDQREQPHPRHEPVAAPQGHVASFSSRFTASWQPHGIVGTACTAIFGKTPVFPKGYRT